MNLTAIFVPAIVFFTIYKIIEVLTHRKERIIIADKLEQMSNLNDSNLPDRLNQFFSERKKYTSLRAGSVLLGMGLGFLVGFIIQYCCFGLDYNYVHGQLISVIYMGSILIFGGAALLGSFVIERTMDKNNN
ncbi:MAG: hypothetical protein Q4C26_07120 [Bacteroidales bacterium]|nr:hypothetical protein [Bacteroidales bacterium]